LPKFVFGSTASTDVAQALQEAGVITQALTDIRRIVIDLTAGEIARIYVELLPDNHELAAGLAAGLTAGITVKEGSQMGDIHGVLYRSGKDGDWYFRIMAANGEEIARSSEGYANRTDALSTLELLLGDSVNIETEDETAKTDVEAPIPGQITVTEAIETSGEAAAGAAVESTSEA
jgi:uncharacterized protein YegP (UPF0339 family)